MKTVIAFFKETPMEIAELAFDMVRDTLKERHALAEKIRAGQRKAATPPEAEKPKVRKKKAKAAPAAAVAATPKRKRGPRKRHTPPAPLPESELPLEDGGGDDLGDLEPIDSALP